MTTRRSQVNTATTAHEPPQSAPIGAASCRVPNSQRMGELQVERAGMADAGELLTLQRAAYVTEARLYGDPELPPLTQSLADLRDELRSAVALKAVVRHRIVGAVRAPRLPRGAPGGSARAPGPGAPDQGTRPGLIRPTAYGAVTSRLELSSVDARDEAGLQSDPERAVGPDREPVRFAG